MILNLLKNRLLVVVSIIESSIYVFLWGEGVKLLSPLSNSTLAKIILALSLILILVLTWAIPIFLNSRSYKKDLLEYNPNHFEEKEFGKHFDKYAEEK